MKRKDVFTPNFIQSVFEDVNPYTKEKINKFSKFSKFSKLVPIKIPQEDLDYLKKQTQEDHEESKRDIKKQFFDEANEISPEAWKSLKKNKSLPSEDCFYVNPKDMLFEFIHESPEPECCKENRIAFHHFKYCPMCGKLLNRRELEND